MNRTWLRVLSLIAALLLAAVCAARPVYNYIMEEYSKTGALILEYHSVSRLPWNGAIVIAPEVFEHHLQFLHANGYTMVTVDELGELLRSEKNVAKYIALSFDDGYKDNYTTVLPLLQKYNAKATFAVVGNKIDVPGYLSKADIREMLAAGMEIASHTNSHHDLTEIDPKYLEWEIGVSKFVLEDNFAGLEVRTMSYPNGSYNPKIIAALEQYGYKQALTGITGVNEKAFYKKHPMEMRRVVIIDDGKGPEYFKGLIKRSYRQGLFLKLGIDLGY